MRSNLTGGIRDRDIRVDQGRASDLAQGFVAQQQTVLDPQTIADLLEGLPLTLLSKLSIAYVQSCCVVIAHGECGAHRRIHPSAQDDNRACLMAVPLKVRHCGILFDEMYRPDRLAAQSSRF